MSEQIRNMAYINILNDTLTKKIEVLEKLEEYTGQQAALLKAETLDANAFDKTIEEKEKLLSRLTLLDDGFMDIYERARKDVTEEPEKYKKELSVTKTLIADITELSTALEAAEQRNKASLAIHLGKEKQKVKDFKVSSRTAAAYYKNMANRHRDGDSYFIDKKK